MQFEYTRRRCGSCCRCVSVEVASWVGVVVASEGWPRGRGAGSVKGVAGYGVSPDSVDVATVMWVIYKEMTSIIKKNTLRMSQQESFGEQLKNLQRKWESRQPTKSDTLIVAMCCRTRQDRSVADSTILLFIVVHAS